MENKVNYTVFYGCNENNRITLNDEFKDLSMTDIEQLEPAHDIIEEVYASARSILKKNKEKGLSTSFTLVFHTDGKDWTPDGFTLDKQVITLAEHSQIGLPLCYFDYFVNFFLLEGLMVNWCGYQRKSKKSIFITFSTHRFYSVHECLKNYCERNELVYNPKYLEPHGLRFDENGLIERIVYPEQNLKKIGEEQNCARKLIAFFKI